MNKALEILKHYSGSVAPIAYTPKQVYEAIAELEAMNNMLIGYVGEDVKSLKKLESKSCENCKHFKKVSKHYEKKICSILNVGDIGGCGDYWESKC